jgi:sulfur-carrier protein
MAVTFHIPGQLQSLTDGLRSVQLDIAPASLREALDALFMVYPGVRDRIVNEQGILRDHINLFVGKEDARYLGGLAASLNGPAEIVILPAVSGGCAGIE